MKTKDVIHPLFIARYCCLSFNIVIFVFVQDYCCLTVNLAIFYMLLLYCLFDYYFYFFVYIFKMFHNKYNLSIREYHKILTNDWTIDTLAYNDPSMDQLNITPFHIKQQTQWLASQPNNPLSTRNTTTTSKTKQPANQLSASMR